MTRREFFGSAALAASALPAFGAEGTTRKVVPTPNFVFFLADDMTWTDAGCYGNPDVRTPHIDQLAREGLRFTQNFTATAMCSPTRQMIYTGMFPVKSGAYPNHAKVKPGLRSVVHYLRELGYRVGLAGKRHFWPYEAFDFERLSDKPLDFSNLEEFLTRDDSQPFCLMVTSNQPHTPWDQGDASAYDPAELSIPPYMVDTPETQQALADYYAEITFLDAQLGRTLDLLQQTGHAENTLVMFSSEQGSNLPHCKWTLYDTGIRTQLIARWPGRIEAGATTDALVQYCDLLPTWIELAGGQQPSGLDGRSIAPLLLGERETHRDAVFALQTTRGIYSGSDCYPIRAIRDGRWKYIWNLNAAAAFSNTVIQRKQSAGGVFDSWRRAAADDPGAAEKVRMYEFRPADELYDTHADPFELDNLAGQPRYRGLLDSMRSRLQAWMREQGDLGVPTEMEALEHQTPTGRET